MSSERKFGIVLIGVYLAFLLLKFKFQIIERSLVWYSPVAILILLTALTPNLLKPVRKVWLLIGHILGVINSTVILSIIYFIIISPIALIRRLFSSKNKENKTSWVATNPGERGGFYKQY